MRIDKVNSVSQIYKAQLIEPVTKPKEGQTDQVIFSSEGIEIQNASKVVKSSPDIRVDKVAAIKEQIKAGTYKLDAEATSQAIMKKLEGRG